MDLSLDCLCTKTSKRDCLPVTLRAGQHRRSMLAKSGPKLLLVSFLLFLSWDVGSCLTLKKSSVSIEQLMIDVSSGLCLCNMTWFSAITLIHLLQPEYHDAMYGICSFLEPHSWEASFQLDENKFFMCSPAAFAVHFNKVLKLTLMFGDLHDCWSGQHLSRLATNRIPWF